MQLDGVADGAGTASASRNNCPRERDGNWREEGGGEG